MQSTTGQIKEPSKLNDMLTLCTIILEGLVIWKLKTVSSVVGMECDGSTLMTSSPSPVHCALGCLISVLLRLLLEALKLVAANRKADGPRRKRTRQRPPSKKQFPLGGSGALRSGQLSFVGEYPVSPEMIRTADDVTGADGLSVTVTVFSTLGAKLLK